MGVVTQPFSTVFERPSLRLRHNTAVNTICTIVQATAGVVRADLVRRRLVMSARAVRAEMRCPTNEIVESGV